MEKYRNFTNITSECLDGKLVELNLSYLDNDNLNVLVSYEVNDYFTLDYQVEVNVKDKVVSFLSHGSHSGIDKVRLNKEPRFDNAVSDYFFGTH